MPIRSLLPFTALLGAAVLSMAAAAPVTAKPTRGATLGVMTFNVKVDLEVDASCPPWNDRKDLCLEVVKKANPDLIGFQETSPNQLAFFKHNLPGYGVVGPLPLSAHDMDYFKQKLPFFAALNIRTYTDVVLMYKKAEFDKLGEGHWWLSPTPARLSSGFGNVFPRILIWAKLKYKATGRVFIVAVTHFDNTLPAQIKMAALSHKELKRFTDAHLPALFCGDFNTSQTRGDYPKLVSDGWRDSYLVCPKASKNGRDDNVPTVEEHARIDHIFYHGDAFKPLEWKRLESPDPHKALSDHFPVYARFALR